MSEDRDFKGAKRIVVKAGTRVITHDDGGVALAQVFGLVEDVGRLRKAGREMLMVSSGAVGLGCEVLGFERTPTELAARQMCAAVGQSRLMGMYEEGLAHMGLAAGQVLLTQEDFVEAERLKNLSRTLNEMLSHQVLPIINENDAVSTDELVIQNNGFGDNDRLSALVASHLGADLLILLTNVRGVLDGSPDDANAKVIPRLEKPESHVVDAARSSGGRGGMRSKLDSAALAAAGGCNVVIASGREAGNVQRIIEGQNVGTWIPARGAG